MADNNLTVFRLAENLEVVDSFHGARMWWNLSFDEHQEHKLVLVFHKRHHEGKKYHSDDGKAWKRGYLRNGPSGVGKSCMITAMSKFLWYDVYDYDLDLTIVRKLFLETTEQSIIVIEDIHVIEDDLITLCKDKKATNGGELPFDYENEKGKVTLSGAAQLRRQAMVSIRRRVHLCAHH
uniref:ATPase AAA-type core domain-containing protein n=1 Tax=Oryza glumipatula TaxID=40148 RepID=A0A0E0BSK3_9ORYZ